MIAFFVVGMVHHEKFCVASRANHKQLTNVVKQIAERLSEAADQMVNPDLSFNGTKLVSGHKLVVSNQPKAD